MTVTRDSTRDYQFIAPLRNEQMKTFAKRDVSGRVIVLYEAPVHAVNGDPCLATVYYYLAADASPIATQERQAIWSGTWDTDADAILVNGDVGYVP